MDDNARRGLAKARRVLEANRGQEHDHRDGPCPACGGEPLDTAVQHYRRPHLFVVPNDESEDE